MTLEVLVDISTDDLDRVFDYEGEASVGSRVLVPFGNKTLIGFVLAVKEKSDFNGRLKPIIKVLDQPISAEMIKLIFYMKDKFFLRYIDVVRLLIPSALRFDKSASLKRLFLKPSDSLSASVSFKRAVKQAALAESLLSLGELSLTKAVEEYGISAVNGLIEKGYAVKFEKELLRIPFKDEVAENKIVKLTDEQKKALDIITESEGLYLLHGVTGSGKTEIYQRLIERALSNNKTAIMLVPEISLTPQVLKIMRARFGSDVAILHSGLSDGERFDEWTRLKNGEAKIAVGARSAVFAPLSNVGIIIIDEEHDSSYISDSNPRFDTRLIAKFRAEYNKCSLVLGSATPDVETYKLADEGKYKLVEMPNRISGSHLPPIEIVSMANEIRNGNNGIFSYALTDALKSTVERNEKAMIFINRRGFSSFIMCRDCGYIPVCEECDVSLTYHKDVEKLKCHYCGRAYAMPSRCPKCGSLNIKHGRTGTQKVKEEIEKLIPDAKVIRMDNDTTARKGSHFEILDKFSKGEANVLVGTQMIAKGHDFSDVTLVGILDADFSLYFDDYRSSERTFQLVTQVAGRAGRADKEGKVILQTFSPNNYVFRFAKNYDYKGFYAKEINTRLVTKFPPFSVIVRVLCTGEDDKLAFETVKNIYLKIKELPKDNFIYLGAMRSPINKIKNKIRYQVLMRLKCEVADETIKIIHKIVYENKGKTNCFVELNPQSLN